MESANHDPFKDPVEGIWEVSAKEYHADRQCVSHSAVEVFRDSIPAYHGQYVTGTMPQRKASEEMNLGTALHVMLLEPDKWDELVAVAPEFNNRSNAGKEEKRVWLAGLKPDTTIITAEQQSHVRPMFEALMRNREARRLLEKPGVNEATYRWRCRETDIWCKFRADRLLPGYEIVDIKTAEDSDPHVWPRRACDFGYHRQSAFYAYGASVIAEGQANLGCARHFGVVVQSKPPYRVVVFSLKRDDLLYAHEQNMEDLRLLRDCRQFDAWADRWNDVVFEWELPPWEKKARPRRAEEDVEELVQDEVEELI